MTGFELIEMDSLLKEGWLTKQGGVIKTWKRRWFVLNKSTLIYYKKPGAEEQGRIQLDSASNVLTAPECKRQPSFKVITKQRTFYMVADVSQQVSEWIAAISSAMASQNVVESADSPPPPPPPKRKAISIESFELLKVLGRGTYGKVQLVKKKDSGKIYAMKSMSKAKLAENDQLEQTLTEKEVLIQTKHPFLVSAHYTFQTDTKIFMVLDYVPGGELFGRLKEESYFEENRVRLYAAEILLGIGHLHSLGLVYRDLKPENILIDQRGHIRITDFGLAKNIGDDGTTSTFCGTPEYIAPEMLQRQPYNKAVDWWSFGIIIFEMLTGLPPFYDGNVNTMYHAVLHSPVKFPSNMSQPARDLVTKLLDRDPTTRLGSNGVEEVKQHPFFQDLDWDDVLEKKTLPEWVPQIQSAVDTSNFDGDFTQEPTGLTYEEASVISPETQEAFENFSYKMPKVDGMGDA